MLLSSQWSLRNFTSSILPGRFDVEKHLYLTIFTEYHTLCVHMYRILVHFRWLTTHLEGDSKSGLEQLLSNQDPITVESTEYNWNLNKL